MRGESLCRHHGDSSASSGGFEPAQGWSAEPRSDLSSNRGLTGDGAAYVRKRGPEGRLPPLGAQISPSLETPPPRAPLPPCRVFLFSVGKLLGEVTGRERRGRAAGRQQRGSTRSLSGPVGVRELGRGGEERAGRQRAPQRGLPCRGNSREEPAHFYSPFQTAPPRTLPSSVVQIPAALQTLKQRDRS